MLSIRRQHDTLILETEGEPDPFLLQSLLRHRPENVLPFTLKCEGEHLTFFIDVSGLESLGSYLNRMGKNASGKQLLLQLISALQAARERLLWSDSALLTPGLIFLHANAVYTIILPIASAFSTTALLGIFNTLQTTEDFSPKLTAEIQAALQEGNYTSVIALLEPPAQQKTKMERRQRKSPYQLLLHWQRSIERFIRRQKARQPSSWSREITTPLAALDEGIGIISEGAPGTRSEEAGEKAFILVDEFIFGRDVNKVDFFLDDAKCGRIHARIIRRRGLFFIEDLGSKHGTVVDGVRLQRHKEMLLPALAKIQFANLIYYFSSE